MQSHRARLDTCSKFRTKAHKIKNTPGLRHIKNHSSILLGNRVYVIGGIVDGKRSKAVYILNPTSLAWSRLELQDDVIFSENLALLVDESIFLLCGMSPCYRTSRTWRFDVVTQRLEPCHCVGNMLVPTYIAAGQYVETLDYIVVVGDRFSAKGKHIPLAFHVESRTWTRVDAKGNAPESMESLYSCLHRNFDMYIVGNTRSRQSAVYLLRCLPGRFTWHQPVWTPMPPVMKAVQMMCVGNRILITGGELQFFNGNVEIGVYDLNEVVFSAPVPAGDRSHVIEGRGRWIVPLGNPQGTGRHSLVCAGNKLLLIGGTMRNKKWLMQVVSPAN